MGAGGLILSALRCAHLGQLVGSLCYFANVSKIGQDSAGRSAFCPLCCFAFVGLVVNVPLFRFLRGFNWVYRLFVWVCIACVLCVACVAFVCVRG